MEALLVPGVTATVVNSTRWRSVSLRINNVTWRWRRQWVTRWMNWRVEDMGGTWRWAENAASGCFDYYGTGRRSLVHGDDRWRFCHCSAFIFRSFSSFSGCRFARWRITATQSGDLFFSNQKWSGETFLEMSHFTAKPAAPLSSAEVEASDDDYRIATLFISRFDQHSPFNLIY